MSEVEDSDLLDSFVDYFDNEEEKEETVAKEQTNNFMTIAGYPALDFSLLCFFITLICSIYIFNVMSMQPSKYTALNMRNAKSPIPFFDSPYIEDYYDGKIDITQTVHSSPLAVIIFYTPWSTRSFHNRQLFHDVAEHFALDDMLKFVAVNCFNKKGSCREKYKIPTFPMLAVFTENGFLSYRGDLEEQSVINWLNSLKAPYVEAIRLSSFQNIRSLSENVVIGYFRFNGMQNPSGFMSFYIVSMLHKKGVLADKLTTFCLIRDAELAEMIGLEEEGIYYYFGNDEYAFYDEEYLQTTEIIDWIEKQREQTVGKVELLDISVAAEVKNAKFSELLGENKLLLYVDKNPEQPSTLMNVLSFIEISQDYWTCDSNIQNNNAFEGLGCASNGSLKFVYLPLTDGQLLLSKISSLVTDTLKTNNNASKSMLLILDESNELVTIHNSSSWDDSAVRQFVTDYHEKSVKSSLQTRILREPSTELIKTKISAMTGETKESVIRKASLEEILRDSKSTKKDMVVLISGNKENVFTSVSLSKFHTLAQMFARFSRHISFRILDITASHLPYHLNFASLPVLMIIPSDGRSDFHVLSPNSPVDIPTMVNFVLEHVSSLVYRHQRLKNCKALILEKIRKMERRLLRISAVLNQNSQSSCNDKLVRKLLRRKKHYKLVADKLSTSLMRKRRDLI
ncbi:unnamed protein product [Auanema sp. JU1783]|nr:unnamed protein product [Auanema sp. JU1783]